MTRALTVGGCCITLALCLALSAPGALQWALSLTLSAAFLMFGSALIWVAVDISLTKRGKKR